MINPTLHEITEAFRAASNQKREQKKQAEQVLLEAATIRREYLLQAMMSLVSELKPLVKPLVDSGKFKEIFTTNTNCPTWQLCRTGANGYTIQIYSGHIGELFQYWAHYGPDKDTFRNPDRTEALLYAAKVIGELLSQHLDA